jgi:hypothetical protein
MVLCLQAAATTYHVAPNGNDQATGITLAEPWGILQKAGETADDPEALRVRTTDGCITVLDVDGGLHLQVFDMTGLLIFSTTTELGDQRINVVTSGVYLIQLTDRKRDARWTARVLVP